MKGYLGAARTTPPQGRLGGVAVGAHPNNTQIIRLATAAHHAHHVFVPLRRPPPRLLRRRTGIGSGRLPRDPHLGRWRPAACGLERPADLQLPHIVWIERGRLDHVVPDALHCRERRREDTRS